MFSGFPSCRPKSCAQLMLPTLACGVERTETVLSLNASRTVAGDLVVSSFIRKIWLFDFKIL